MAKVKLTVVVSLMLLVPAGLARAADQGQVAKAKAFLNAEERAKAILVLMHPTADFQGLDFVKETTVTGTDRKVLDGWFCLRYRWNWKGLFGNEWSELDFIFDHRGKIYSIETGRTTSVVGQFEAANVVMAALKKELIEAFKDDPAAQKQIGKYIEGSDVKGLATFLLKIAQDR